MPATTIRIVPYGRLANRMIQLMFARAVQSLAQSSVQIEGYDLPEWELTKAASLSRQHSAFSIGYTARASTIASLIDRYNPQQIDLSQVIARATNFLPRHEYFDLFPLPDGEGKETDVNELLIHIRLGDVKTLTHPIYGPLPISYYKYLIDKTGFRPVFMGEIDDSPYCTALRVTFPYAKFLPRSSVRNDFQSIRRAHNVALSVSSFSWVAAYLSGAQRIHLPLCGMFNFKDRAQYDFLPNDRRFTFHSIPHRVWAARYSDYEANNAKFHPASVATINKSRFIATIKTAGRRARIRFGMERRLFMAKVARIAEL